MTSRPADFSKELQKFVDDRLPEGSPLHSDAPVMTQAEKDVEADAFQQMFSAAMKINEVLSGNERLNDSVPENWPLPLSADEFAHACLAMRNHYEELAK